MANTRSFANINYRDMLKPTTYIILAVFLITLEIYRVPTPLGLNITFSQIFFALALFMGLLAFLSGSLRIKINRETKTLLLIFIVFASYSFISFVRNIGTIRSESISSFLAELVGYIIVLSLPLLIRNISEWQKVIKAFLASSVFIYLGSFWHIYNYSVYGQFVTDTPFWGTYSKSEEVLEYLSDVAWTGGFPRFRLPFSSPAATGVFLSLCGIILLATTLYHIKHNRKWLHILILANVINLFCLLGTFARASWAVFSLGSLFIIWYFQRFQLISFGKITLILLVVTGLFLCLYWLDSIWL